MAPPGPPPFSHSWRIITHPTPTMEPKPRVKYSVARITRRRAGCGGSSVADPIGVTSGQDSRKARIRGALSPLAPEAGARGERGLPPTGMFPTLAVGQAGEPRFGVIAVPRVR